MKATILLVEDNPHIMKINSEALAMHGYRVLEAETLAEGRTLFEAEQPDLILLDIMMPDGSGLDFCEELRAQRRDIPILFLTALNENSDVVQGLQAGGDDYITKPYAFEVLLARMEALLRRANRPMAFQLGNLRLDYAARHGYCNGTDLMLTPKEFFIMEMLGKSHGRAVSAGALYETIWGARESEDMRAVKVRISRLRAKLAAAGCGVAIKSERGEGYYLAESKPEENGSRIEDMPE